MKNILYLISILSFVTQVYGQSPVTSISWLRNPGDKFYFYQITQGQTSDPTINPGDTGANVVWNFNHKNFLLAYPDDSATYTTPSAIGITPVNSQVNLALGDSTNYGFYIKNSQGLMYAQSRSTAKNNPEYPITYSVYTNPHIDFKTNLSFRDSFYDTAVYYRHYRYSLLDSPSRGKSISLHKYDGFGTLNVAGIQIDSVIRVTEERYQRDSQYNNPNKFYSYAKIYTWHSRLFKNNILTYVEAYNVKINGSSHDTTRYKGLTLKIPAPYPTSIPNPPAESQNALNAYISGNTIEVITDQEIGNTIYILYNLQGRELKSGEISLYTQKRNSIPINNLSPGTYILKLQNTKVNQTIKLT